MEYAKLSKSKSSNKLFKLIQEIPKEFISLTAETKRYANYLSAIVNKDIEVEPYPLKKVILH